MEQNNENVFVRPNLLSDFIGQKDIIDTLKISIKSAKMRNETLDHIIFYGPSGLGKTTLSNIIASELNCQIIKSTASSIEKPSDIICLLCSLQPGDLLFIDEIHRLPKNIEEILYSAMEDFQLNVVINRETEAKNISIDLPPFTLIGATTKIGLLSEPLRNRFGMTFRLKYYSVEDLSKIVDRASQVYDFPIDSKSSYYIAKCSRFTPRIAINLYKRVRDYCMYKNLKCIDFSNTLLTFKLLEIDEIGLTGIDKSYLTSLKNNFNCGPTGIESISISINEDSKTVEENIEPYLIQLGFINRTNNGRVLTEKGKNYLNKL